MSFLSRIVVLTLLFLPAGCGATSSQRVPFPAQDVTVTRSDLTRIYFLREEREGVQRNAIVVSDEDREIGDLTSGTYLCWERPAGRTVGRAFYKAFDPGRGKVEGIADLNCHAGQAYYFNVTVSREDGKPSVHLLDAEEGRRLVAERKPAGE